MKGIVPIGSSRIEIRDFEFPEPGKGQVIIDVKCSGICGSDLNTYRMTWDEIGERQNLILGHEAGGIVTKIGPCVSNIKVGDRVCVYHFIGCNNCKYCHEGSYGWCENMKAYGLNIHGAMSEYLLAEEKNCCPFPEELPFEDATFLACSAGTAYASLKKLDSFATNGYIAIIGLGPIGLVASVIASYKGWDVIALDLSEIRVDFAKKQGINAIIRRKDMEIAEQVKQEMGGKQPARIFDTSGHPGGLADAFNIASKGTHIVSIGKGKRKYKYSDDMSISELIEKQITLQGSWVFTLPDYYELLEFMVDKKISFESIVTDKYKFSEAREAFERAADVNHAGKVVFIN